MTSKEIAQTTVVAGVAAMVADKAVAKMDSAAVEKAFKTLESYDWGDDRNSVKAIDEAIIATQGDAAGREVLEKGLVEALASGLSRSAQDYVCRRLRIMGTSRSVDALAALLPDEKTSHIARYALERIQNETALDALRDALPKVGDKLKPGIIGALGTRRDTKSVKAVSKCLGDSDASVARAAAHALALIGTPSAAKALTKFAKKAPAGMKMPVADASLICAEQLLADGEKGEAVAMYKSLQGTGQPKHVKVAAMKGMLTAASSK